MLKGTKIQAGNDEFIVKTYHASKFRSRFTNVRSDGHLYITNQRVIFRAVATDSLIHSEIPIDNVSGVNMYYGEYRDWMNLLIFFAFVFGVMAPLFALLNAANFIGGSDNSGVQVIIFGVGLLTLILAITSNHKINKAYTVFYSEPGLKLSTFQQGIVSIISLMCFLWLSTSGFNVFTLLLSLGSLLLTISAIRAIPRKHSMSLAIISKGGSSTPIMIAGANSNGMVFSAAAQALEAEPGADASKLVEELGAIIHDIQTLGTLGVERWMKNTPIFSSSSDTPPSDTPPTIQYW